MNDGFRNVLMIAYYFPPLGLSGVQRTAKFAKYLPKYGWKPTVLTVEPAGYYAFDESLLKEMDGAGVEIVRTSSYDLNHLFRKRGVVKMPSETLRKIIQLLGDAFFIPDTKIGWKSNAVRAGSTLLKQRHFDLIFATAPPQTDFLVGSILKRKFDIPLVLDYRDEWLQYPFKYFPTPIHRMLHKRMERRVLKDGFKVTVTHRRMKENLLKRHRSLAYNDVHIVSQGFDPEDFDGLPAEKKVRGNRLRIAHAGTFYGGRSPSVLFHALANVLKQQPRLRGRFEIQLIGTRRGVDAQLVQKLGLQEEVTFNGYMEHRECIRKLSSADVLWYVNDNDLSAPGKLYEYFGARKSIFASVVEGYTRQLIEECGASVCVPLRDVPAHEKALLGLLDRFEQKKLPRISGEFAERFNRLSITGELAKHFETLMDYDRNAFERVEEARA